MRQRIISVATWIAVTILATGIGFVAINTVGDVLRGSGPLGEDFSTSWRSYMAETPNRRAAAKAAAELVLRNELDRVASAAVDAIRERVRAIPADRRHVLVVDGQQIEVVETSAVVDSNGPDRAMVTFGRKLSPSPDDR